MSVSPSPELLVTDIRVGSATLDSHELYVGISPPLASDVITKVHARIGDQVVRLADGLRLQGDPILQGSGDAMWQEMMIVGSELLVHNQDWREDFLLMVARIVEDCTGGVSVSSPTLYNLQRGLPIFGDNAITFEGQPA